MMKIEFNSRVEDKDKELIKSLVVDSFLLIGKFLNINSIVVKIDIDKSQVIPEWGVGGMGDSESIDLFLEKNLKFKILSIN